MLRLWQVSPGDKVAVMTPPNLQCAFCDLPVHRPLEPSRTGEVIKAGRKWLQVRMDGNRRPIRKFLIHDPDGFNMHVPELRKVGGRR